MSRKYLVLIAIVSCLFLAFGEGQAEASGASHRTRITAAGSASHVLAGKAFTIVGHATGAASGAKVYAQQLVHGSWRTFQSSNLNRRQAYAIKTYFSRGGVVNYRMLLPGTKKFSPSHSSTRAVTVYRWHWLYQSSRMVYKGITCGEAATSLNGKEYLYSIEDCTDGSAGDSNHDEFNLGRQCTTFNATFGLDDSSDPNTPVALTVGADSASLFSATEQLGEDTPVTIDITNHLRLSLSYVETADDPNNENGVHPDFGNPRVLCSF